MSNFEQKKSVKSSAESSRESSVESRKDEEINDSVKDKENMDKKETRDVAAQLEEMTNLLKRVQAEFDNYRKRTENERKQDKDYHTAETTRKILPVLDSFDLALKNKDKIKNGEELKGLELIYSQLFSILEELGLRPIVCCGLKFNQEYHEVLLIEKCESEKDEGVVVAELQKGYMFKDKVIRHSKVKVLKAEKICQDKYAAEKHEKEDK